jgi:hypothetical protein
MLTLILYVYLYVWWAEIKLASKMYDEKYSILSLLSILNKILWLSSVSRS